MTPARGIYMSGIFAIISEKENRIADAEGAAGLMTEGLSVYGRADCGYEILGAAGWQLILGSCISGMHQGVPAGKPVIMTKRFIAVCDAIIYNARPHRCAAALLCPDGGADHGVHRLPSDAAPGLYRARDR